MYHETAVREVFNNEVEIDTASSAKDGVEKLTLSVDKPYDFILTDMQMEPDFIPLYAGEWFIRQIKFFDEYKKFKNHHYFRSRKYRTNCLQIRC